MGQVQLSGISLSFGERSILKDITLSIASKSRIALSGANGSGKTTLMKIIAGEMEADSGKISMQKGTLCVYLPQSGIEYTGDTLYNEAEKAFFALAEKIKKKRIIETELGEIREGDKGYIALLEKHHLLEEELVSRGYYDRDQEITRVLTGLGFKKEDLDRFTNEFSGGWQMRIALAKVLLKKPDILLLDEPTNYLDLEAREWLTEWITVYPGGMLIVSHDRDFLDVITTETCELFHGDLKRYQGNYSAYEKKRKQELEVLVANFEKQQEEIQKAEDFIRRFRSNASKAALAQSRLKWLEKLEIIEIPETLKSIHFSFPNPPHSGRKVLTATEISKSYGSLKVLDNITFSVDRGEKIFLGGVNGAGKSTLLRILAGIDNDYSGDMDLGKDVSIGYFSQDIEAGLKDEYTVYEQIEASAPTSLIPQIRNMLGAFLFRGDDIQKKTEVLSGGEKNRLSLLKLLLHPANLLILDEPTNHLDMHSKDVLLDSLKKYKGTLFFVSHDRYFIKNLATKVFEINNGTLTTFHGDYSYFLWKKLSEENVSPEKAVRLPGLQKQKREEDQKQKSGIRKLKRKEETLLEEIEILEKGKDSLNHDLSLPEVYSDPQRAAETHKLITECEARLEKLIKEWEGVLSELE